MTAGLQEPNIPARTHTHTHALRVSQCSFPCWKMTIAVCWILLVSGPTDHSSLWSPGVCRVSVSAPGGWADLDGGSWQLETAKWQPRYAQGVDFQERLAHTARVSKSCAVGKIVPVKAPVASSLRDACVLQCENAESSLNSTDVSLNFVNVSNAAKEGGM